MAGNKVFRRRARGGRQWARACDDDETWIGRGMTDFQQRRIDVGTIERYRVGGARELDDHRAVGNKIAAHRRDLSAARHEAAAEALHHGRDLLRIATKLFRVVDAMRSDREGLAGAGVRKSFDRVTADAACLGPDVIDGVISKPRDDGRAQGPRPLEYDDPAGRDDVRRIDPGDVDRGPSGNQVFQRENFLYLIRCGMVESVPSRRILSAS